MILRHLRARARLRRRELTEDEQAHVIWAQGLLKKPVEEVTAIDGAALLANMEPPCVIEQGDEIPTEWSAGEAERGYNICVDCMTVGTAAMCPKCGKDRLWEPPEEIVEELG